MSIRGALVLAACIGSLAAQTATWEAPAPAAAPPARSSAVLVHHDAAGHALLFGGLQSLAASQVFGDTWVWDGSDWRAAPGGPPARYGSRACYDPVGRRVVLWGGFALPFPTLLNDTWEHDGVAWRSIPTAQAPAFPGEIAWDGNGGHVMCFRPNETWRLDADRWTRLRIGGGPIGFIVAAAWHAASARTVVVSARDARLETWLWHGSGWEQAQPIHAPPPRTASQLVAHSTRPVLMLVEGIEFVVPREDLWEWNGSDWRERFPAARHGLDRGFAVGADPGPGALIAFGMNPSAGPTSWRFVDGGDLASLAPLGYGCRGTAGTPNLSSADRPWLGETVRLQLTGLPPSRLAVPFGLLGFSAEQLGAQGLPLDLGSIGMPGCWLRVSAEVDQVLGNAFGTATWNVPLPADPALQGLVFHLQALVLDHDANAFGATLSNALTARVFSR